MKKYACAFLAVIMLLVFVSGGCTVTVSRYEATYLDLFDTVTTITLYAKSKAEFTDAVGQVYDDLSYYNKLFDIYNAYDGINNAYTLNESAAAGAVKADDALIDILKFAKEMYAATEGRVNAAFGSVLSLWHEFREAGMENPDDAALPDMEMLAEANEHTDINDIIINEQSGTVTFADTELKIDLGAIAKGYAAQKACDKARERGIDSMLLSLGGNVCTIGTRADGQEWAVGIQDPDDLSAYIGKVSIDNASLVTSGAYQRYYVVDGVEYNHIIDPTTLMPARYIQAVTVLYTDSAVCDALSTALFNMTQEEGAKLAKRFGVGAVWILYDGTIIATDIDMTRLS